ncbi:endolytic transglycosylase MltG [Parasphingorhabdus cellanae]|uniref:Endolytic murein transglycosylase n=1 Tax=Parasphingorhabdus cellanae TaxID=2806553 RepID=A0ABX7T8S9_9SPHN|nr:endolytic transglycosylase MltG [Parasphingorhabdus cellanae]QTD56383.1 endolytic transglycosylase MltG [Parasphingorhabdus cellanae]
MRRFGCLILIIATVIFGLVAGNFIYGWNASGPLENEQAIIIKSGSSLSMAAQALEEEGAIKSADAFLNRAKIFGGSEPIKAGEFIIPAGASNATILNILQGGKTIQRLITIPEGTPSIIVHEKLMAEKLLTGEIPVPAEGSILPDSYSFERGESRAAVVARMQKAMTETIAELWPKKTAASVVKTPEEAIILAAIVEKETALARERRTVAAVYSNRVNRNMMLQADPTIIYPITKGKPLGRRIRQSEIAAVNDYNTYSMVGLPKGPIANPGRASIEAVLDPADSDYLFFVADGKGGHVFAKTLAEHNANVEKWFAIRRERGEM